MILVTVVLGGRLKCGRFSCVPSKGCRSTVATLSGTRVLTFPLAFLLGGSTISQSLGMKDMRKFLALASVVLVLTSLPATVRGDCDVLDGEPRDGLGFSGCRGTDDAHRVCYTKHLDVVYTDATSDSEDVQHELMTVEKFVERAKTNEIKVVSASVASMKCPEITPCFPLQTKTLVATKREGLLAVPMSELALGDDIVVGWGQDGQPITSPVVNFAHRSDRHFVSFVSLHTEHGSAIQGSPEHNIHVLTEGGARLETTFGKLAEHVGDPTRRSSPRFLQTPRGGPVKIVSTSWAPSHGFVAPVTKSGSLLVMAEARTDAAASTTSVHDAADTKWIAVSCFSTVPDALARVVHHVRMLPVYAGVRTANDNVDGAGMGYMLDALAAVGSRLGRVMGHTATSHRVGKRAAQRNQQPCSGGNAWRAHEAFSEL